MNGAHDQDNHGASGLDEPEIGVGMAKLSAELPDAGLLLGAKGNLTGGQDEVEQEYADDNWPTYLGHVSLLEKSGESIHHTCTQVHTGHQDHVTPHKQNKGRTCEHL
jgi:hypothetical protein